MSTRRSFLLSADTAHAVHPNYADKHSPTHAPKLNSGIVIKSNDNQRYATNAESGFVVRELALTLSLTNPNRNRNRNRNRNPNPNPNPNQVWVTSLDQEAEPLTSDVATLRA